MNSTQSAMQMLTRVGFLEGCSFLLLLGVAMPLKYVYGIHEAVRIVGSAHGLLFMAYLVVLLITANRIKLPLWAMPAGVIAAVLPFGPFVFDYALKRSVENTSVTDTN
ncbi:DUF3817 domain-containing protein [Bacterioplanoides sp. SCSIO 12839]|uniref:DUF3817 domain-containing protein n=1 Tax=Bacterioplanoides sp. SCSIO 12839 TaxID=2829569 RepID=UPI002104774F|nr:DUF3817 domain-containing protein [Bacterioplanoides sp. SCSIO 12839]UTW48181.1 DUF3817 domain-containing protein [Bacterioplanoides sp. SCSIO 12839]